MLFRSNVSGKKAIDSRQSCEMRSLDFVPQFGTKEVMEESYTALVSDMAKKCTVSATTDKLIDKINSAKLNVEISTESSCPPQNPKYSTSHKDSEDWHICQSITVDKVTYSRHVSMSHISCLFENIPASDLEVLGFVNGSHPRNFILEILPVIPERNRHPIERDGEIKYDHLTVMYQAIIKRNNTLRLLNNRPEKDESAIADCTKRLYNDISCLMKNTDGKCVVRNKEPLLSLSERLTGKEGLCRANAQGKRVNFCGRSVAGGAICPFGTVIIPEAMNILTIPERVTPLNYDRVIKYAKDGKVIHYTAGSGSKSGLRIRYSVAGDITIKLGDLVERLGEDGDDFIINRQPSLHRHSLIGTRAVYRRGQKTIKIHMSITSPLNADFDGDELNLFLPRTNRARAELRHLLGANKQLASPKSGGVTMGIVFNAPIAGYIYSLDSQRKIDEKFVDFFELENLIGSILIERDRLKTLPARLKKHGVLPYTRRAVISMIFPEDFFYTRGDDEDSDNSVIIRDGVFLGGILLKKDFSEKLVHSVLNKYGGNIAGRFITEMTYFLDWYLELRGFTIGIMDMIPSNTEDVKKRRERVDKKIGKAKIEIAKIKSVEPKTDLEKMYRESEITSILQSVLKIGDKLAKEDKKDNSLAQMIGSGAKGGPTNMAQIAGLLGPQFVNGRLPEPTMFGDRTCLIMIKVTIVSRLWDLLSILLLRDWIPTNSFNIWLHLALGFWTRL